MAEKPTLEKVLLSLPKQFQVLKTEAEMRMVQGFHVKKEFWGQQFDWAYIEYARVLKDQLSNIGASPRMMLCQHRAINFMYFVVDCEDGIKHIYARTVTDISDTTNAVLTKVLSISKVDRMSSGSKLSYERLNIESEVWRTVEAEMGDQVQLSVYKESEAKGDWTIVIKPQMYLTTVGANDSGTDDKK